MIRFSHNSNLEVGQVVYYYPNSAVSEGLHPCKILEKLDTQKHGYGMLTYYLVEKSCSVDCFIDMLTNMQIYTQEQKDEKEKKE